MACRAATVWLQLAWRVFLHAMNTGRRKTAISTEQRKTTFPRRQSSCGRKGPAVGLDHVKRRQPKSRNCSYSSCVSPQLHQRKTRNCGLAHLRREAATKHEGRVCKAGAREGWPCVGYTPPLHLQHEWVYSQRMCTTETTSGAAAHLFCKVYRISNPCSSVQGTSRGLHDSSTILAPPARHTAASKP